jgi:ribose transport system substrate-binding protein
MSEKRLGKAKLVLLLALGLLVSVALVACGGSSSSSGGGETSATTSEGTEAGEEAGTGEEPEAGEKPASSELAAAEEQLKAAYKGRYTTPPSKPNPAAKNKTIWYISPGQASPNAVQGGIGIKEAAEELGWNFKLYDAKLDPANFVTGIKQAVASGADGIITLAIDCSQVKPALEEAKEEGVMTVTMLGFDCDESSPGEEPLYSGKIGLGKRYKSWPKAYEEWGSDAAAWAIVQKEGKANVLNFTNNEYLIVEDTGNGFSKRMEECSGCVVNNIPWTLGEVGAELTNKVKSSFVKTPEANVLQDSLNPLVGFSTGVEQAGKTESVDVVGGVGMPEDFELMREGKGLNALAAWPFAWWSWAAVDTLNSLFDGNEIEDSGLGWQMVDKKHNMPKAGEQLEPSVDYKAAYRKRWGI